MRRKRNGADIGRLDQQSAKECLTPLMKRHTYCSLLNRLPLRFSAAVVVVILFSMEAAAADKQDALSRAEVTAYLAVQAKLAKDPSIGIADLNRRFGTSGKNTYSAEEVALYLKSKTQQATLPTNESLIAKSGYQGSK